MADQSNLFQVLTERIDAEERSLALLPSGPGWAVEVDGCTCYGGTLPQGHEPGCGTEPGPTWWAYGTLMRHVAEDRDILRRHAPSEFVTIWEHGERYPQCVHGHPDDEEEFVVDSIRWDRCPEVLSVARRYAVSA